MKPTEFILIRHGETFWNVEKRYQGQLDSPLTDLGVAQAQAIAARCQEIKFHRLYSSDLGRTFTTAQYIAAVTGHPIITDMRLRERHGGVIQGLNRAEIQAQYPEIREAYRSGAPDYVIPGGESRLQVLARGVTILEDLAARHPSERLIIVTHGGLLSVFIRHVLGVDQEKPRRFRTRNGSLHYFTFEQGVWHAETLGDVNHLRHLPTGDESE